MSKAILIVVLILMLAGVGVLIWYLTKDDNEDDQSDDEEEVDDGSETLTITYTVAGSSHSKYSRGTDGSLYFKLISADGKEVLPTDDTECSENITRGTVLGRNDLYTSSGVEDIADVVVIEENDGYVRLCSLVSLPDSADPDNFTEESFIELLSLAMDTDDPDFTSIKILNNSSDGLYLTHVQVKYKDKTFVGDIVNATDHEDTVVGLDQGVWVDGGDWNDSNAGPLITIPLS